MATCLVLFLSVFVWLGARAGASHIGLGSRLLARDQNEAWVSDNGTFAFGLTPAANAGDQFQVAIWFADLPGDRTIVWSANRNSLVNKNAFLELDTTGNLVLIDGERTVWMSNTSGAGITSASMEETGNFILHTNNNHSVWQSFEHPSDTLLPNQPLTVSLELTSPKSTSQGGYYSLKMLQQPTSLSLALTYNLPETYDASPEAYANFSYWPGPDISNVTGDVVAVLDDAGKSATNQSSTRLAVLRRLILEANGNLRLYRWDNNVNGSREWVPEWAAVSNPCDIAGICGNGVCNLDRSKTNASCTCLPGTSKAGGDNLCAGNSSSIGGCDSQNENKTSEFRISSVQQTSYYFSDFSVIANYSDIPTVSKCGDACLSDCECVASVYGLDGEKPYCWILRSLDFGGLEATKSMAPAGYKSGKDEEDDARKKVVIIPLVLGMTILAGLLCLLLYYNVHKKRYLKRSMESSHILPGAPIHFTYRDLLIRTCNFSELLGTGGFGSVYKGSLGDGTLVAVKKLDKVLPHGEKEFITEVNTIGSMHHMNLVRLCGYCSEGSQRLLAMMNDTPLKAADRRLEGSVKEEELIRAVKVAFWCIQDEVFSRPSMGEVVKMLEGSMDINTPPMPQTVLELIEEGLEQVYKAMKRDFNQYSSFTAATGHPSSQATCSYSTMSPR
ncbi:hypothetical protein OIU77_008322 [Salix suchowensis]|uniref:Receptor-like serine/threonine-protein kinase n=1 Tax=Salix suchowensis TaxID=1278906 RepID=A0ABQ9AL32_9ROSI|nr:hypothetical protein OIU77_008322 [Salix suchowensis]